MHMHDAYSEKKSPRAAKQEDVKYSSHVPTKITRTSGPVCPAKHEERSLHFQG